MLIWWTNQRDCESLDVPEDPLEAAPEYLRRQFDSRFGRPGRGRLWVDQQFGEVGVDPWPETPLSGTLGALYGGIVIRDEDLRFVKPLRGIVTDFALHSV